MLQDQLAALQAESEAATAAAASKLKEVAAELDGVKNKLLTERASNKRHMEFSAEVRRPASTKQQQSYVTDPNADPDVDSYFLQLLLQCKHTVDSSVTATTCPAAASCICWQSLTLPPCLCCICRKWMSPWHRPAR